LQQLRVYQSTWAMERRRPDGVEWPLDVQLEMIRAAGFDGVAMDVQADFSYAKTVDAFLREHGMSCMSETYPDTLDQLEDVIARVAELTATDHINVLPGPRPHTVAECVPFLEGVRRLAEGATVPVYVETHRNFMTTDLFFTLRLLDCFPDLKLTADLSHYIVGREFAWPIEAHNHALISRILDNAWALHGRVASREQVQIQISFPHHKAWLDLFMDWWAYGIRAWRKRAPADATLTFTCELGPPEYAITGADGYELSDRWQEAQTLKDMIRNLWRKIEDETAKEANDG
jgi:hypothetical protein